MGWGPEAVHTHGIDSFTVILGGAITRLDFAKALGALAGAHGSDLLRVKGIVAFADRGGQPALVQAAQHTMFAPERLNDWPDDDLAQPAVFVVNEITALRNPRVFRLRITSIDQAAGLGQLYARRSRLSRRSYTPAMLSP